MRTVKQEKSSWFQMCTCKLRVGRAYQRHKDRFLHETCRDLRMSRPAKDFWFHLHTYTKAQYWLDAADELNKSKINQFQLDIFPSNLRLLRRCTCGSSLRHLTIDVKAFSSEVEVLKLRFNQNHGIYISTETSKLLPVETSVPSGQTDKYFGKFLVHFSLVCLGKYPKPMKSGYQWGS